MKDKATDDLKTATEAGNKEDIERFSKRTVKMTEGHQEDCKQLLKLMGMPIVEAPCEAEAQCASLSKSGTVWGAGSEDLDTLTFGAPILVSAYAIYRSQHKKQTVVWLFLFSSYLQIRRLAFNEGRKMPILQMDLNKALEGLDLTMEQFIDMCILCGCDYCGTIRGGYCGQHT